ncbi:hypothetical protein KDD17_08550 [Sulfitobacter albidus]|uniref:Uncharacterized protein n=1 Tax=Sulfitobacter albidus TaxID=2829501 RepID=A0A975JBI7_9RHOB|nr:hypothetical protein [Sulfitobacter albidus]QUJ75090.1 hypothetical protein KDD17_08550 [Sulfitobacter albidus]
MALILLLAGLLVTGFFAWRYIQRGPFIADDLMDAPREVRAAAKRQGVQAQPNVYLIDSLSSADVCVAALAACFARMDDAAPVADATLHRALAKHLRCDAATADDLVTLGPWVAAQGGERAFERLTQRLKRLDHGPYFDRLMSVLGNVAAAGSKGMPSARQADALGSLARIFRTA